MVTSDLGWSSVLTARSGPIGSNWLELSCPVAGERALVERDALAAMLLGTPHRATRTLKEIGFVVATGGVNCEFDDRIQRWRDRGWGTALDWYLWSRSPNFRDDGPDAEVQRIAVLEEYLEAEPCPSPPTADDDAMHLTDTDTRGTLGEALLRRRSRGSFSGQPLRMDALAELLVVGMDRVRRQRPLASDHDDAASLLRSHGCAFDLHVMAYDVLGLAQGHYFYEPERQLLDLEAAGDFRDDVSQGFGAQPDQRGAAACLMLVADFDRYSWRYRHERALRNLYIDAGRVLGRLVLVAAALKLEIGVTPLLHDTEMRDLLALDDQRQAVLHTLTVAG